MSEWLPVIALFWVFWAVDGVRLLPQRGFTVAGALARRRARVRTGRWSFAPFSPWGARVVVSDVPFTISPEGICNRPAGTLGRPTEQPVELHAWRWTEVRQAGLAKGWLFINDRRFCPATGHLSAAEVLALADTAPVGRERAIRWRLRRWVRPAHLQRRVRVLAGRTRAIAALNALTFGLVAAASVYAVVGVAIELPPGWNDRLADALPAVLATAFALHVGAIIAAARMLKRLRAVAPEKRGTNLFSALMLPAQALRLRALLGEGYFPAQHPLAVVLALGGCRTRRDAALATLTDLRWPIAGRDDPPLAREIATWFRGALQPALREAAEKRGLACETLFAPPRRESAVSCGYCPRCGDQFGAGRTHCPNGIELVAFSREVGSVPTPARRE